MNGLSGVAPTALPTRGADRWLGAILRRCFGEAPLRFSLRDGTVLHAPNGSRVADVVLGDRKALLSMLWDPEVHFGDLYSAGQIEVEGDLAGAVAAAYRALAPMRRRGGLVGNGHSRHAERDNVQRHYDLGNEFYRLWLDERMVYTCGYFASPQDTLEQAQVAKLDLVCRKLRLSPGETVVEAGAGWGALAMHMARHYGVRVKAYNVSREQVHHARSWAEREGLQQQVEFVEDDYRNIQGRFDAFVSVGMLEHVGLRRFACLGRVIHRCLDPQRGRGLLHFIGRDRPESLNGWIRRRIFPGAYVPTLSQAVERVLEPAGVSVLDVENLRLHYASTLSHWRARFESAADRVSARFGESFMRRWRLYLAGSEAAFLTGSLQLFQVVFARSGSADIPWSRAELYSSEGARGEL